jgi:N-acetyl-anhydromuramyl-L-alanine amidase AmpD
VQELLPPANYDYSTTPRNGAPIVAIFDHIADCTGNLYGGFLSSGLSSHYQVRRDGTIIQFVLDEHAAYTQGIITMGSDFPGWFVPGSTSDGYMYNLRGLGIEHEGKPFDEVGEGFGCLTKAQFESTVALQKYLIWLHNIKVDRDHILGHYRLDHVNRANCPGSNYPWDALFARLQPTA